MTHDLLQDFPGREKKLKGIYRYSMFEVFFYRSNLWDHSQRVALIVGDIASLTETTYPDFDAKQAMVLALVHDDAEMITGDVQLGHKQKMTAEELKKLDEEEASAIEELAAQYPKKVVGFSYKKLLLQALHKDTLEAKIVSLADKLDAYCESLHEVLGGNITALRSTFTYEKTLAGFHLKFPELEPLLQSTDSPFTQFSERANPDFVAKDLYQHFNKPHAAESVRQPTDFPIYNRWRELVIEHIPNGVELLTTQREFLQKHSFAGVPS